MAEPIQLYICYAEANKNALSKLEKHLVTQIRAGMIVTWHHGNLESGAHREQQIATHLDQAQIIIMLVSASLFASSYYDSSEIQHAFQRHEKHNIRLIPIIVEYCAWEEDQHLGGLEPLPRGGKVAGLDDKAWHSIAMEINQTAKQMQAEQAKKEPAPSVKPARSRAKSRKPTASKPQPFSNATLIKARTATHPEPSTPPPALTQADRADQTLPSTTEPQPKTSEANTTTPTFGQDYDQIRDDMLKIVFNILIWEPSRSTHDLIASERRAIHQALLDQHHHSTLGSTLPIPEGVSLQDCEITRAKASDMTFVIVEPEVLSILEWQAFFSITDEKFINKTYCYYPANANVTGQIDKDLHSFKKLDYYQESQISNCHIRTEVLNWVRIKRTFIYRSGQKSRKRR